METQLKAKRKKTVEREKGWHKGSWCVFCTFSKKGPKLSHLQVAEFMKIYLHYEEVPELTLALEWNEEGNFEKLTNVIILFSFFTT